MNSSKRTKVPMRFPLRSSLCLVACALSGVPSVAAEIRLSGTVTDASGKSLPGVRVMLVGEGNATSTDSTGLWSIPATSTGIVVHRAAKAAAVHGLLVLDGSRFRLLYDGADAVGRRFAAPQVGEGASKAAARSTATSVDTLLFSWNGEVRARVGVPSLQSGDLGRQSIDTSTGTVGSSVPWNGSIQYGRLVDSRDGQVYRTVKIGTQRWMAENLNHKVDSSWCFANSADSCARYGRLYSWAAAMKLADSCNAKACSTQVGNPHQGICPSGWHLPRDPQWDTLAARIGGASTAGAKLKSTSGWPASGAGTDEVGFRGIPTGTRADMGYFYGLRDGSGSVFVRYWSSSECSADFACQHGLVSGGTGSYFLRTSTAKRMGEGVRCVED
ncbi:MAG: hypothetical protein IPK50_17010 [Fibrobacterota bacterium]|nr:MAG: hypothetical protein IPK50_17010 [Fibrobacterota bacterium]